MANTEIKIGLAPEEVLAAVRSIGDGAKDLADQMQRSLKQDASGAINDLKDNAEKGSNQITKFFSNMGTRIREDLKTAFDVSSVLAGANFAKQLGEGVRQVFDMERAFSRLNVRMGLSTQQMDAFKRSAGQAVAAAGVNLQDVQPGLMAAASRGNVRDPQQMTMIAQALAQSKQINPDLDTGAVTEDVAEILKRQNIAMTGQNFRQTLDAINSATAAGGFSNSSEAADSIAQISPYARMLGLDSRSMAGLATVSSKAGDTGQETLMQLLKGGTNVDQGARINSLFGSNVFKNGKFDASALANVDTNRFGKISEQVLAETTGISGSSGADLKLFIDTWKSNMDDFDRVVRGSNETADQFGKATDNFASRLDMFKSRVTEAGREIGDGAVKVLDGFRQGALTRQGMGSIGAGIGDIRSSVSQNAGDLAMAGGLSVGAGLLMGGGIRGLIGSRIADAEGIQKVYVTNAGEIAGGGMMSKIGGRIAGWGGGIAGGLASAGGYLSGLGSTSVGSILSGSVAGSGLGAIGVAGAGVLGAAGAGYGIGQGFNYLTGNDKGELGSKLYDLLNPDESMGGGGGGGNTMALRSAIIDGMVEGAVRGRMTTPLTNPSDVRGRGPTR